MKHPEKYIIKFVVLMIICVPGLLSLASCGEDEVVDKEVILGGDADVVCEAESRKCNQNDVVKCNSSGTEWVFFKACSDDQVCENGQCTSKENPDGDSEKEVENE